MNAQPEALRLAEVSAYLEGGERGQWIVAAAAELRRLHAENEAMRNVANRGGHIAVAMSRIADLESQRDALLEALRAFESCALPVSRNIDERGHSWTEAYLDQALPIARAAIKAVEETK